MSRTACFEDRSSIDLANLDGKGRSQGGNGLGNLPCFLLCFHPRLRMCPECEQPIVLLCL